jgi:molybdopterin molybdotransferase
MLSVAEAGKRVCDAVMTLPAEDCPLINAHGRVLRQTLATDRDLPPFDRAAIDG